MKKSVFYIPCYPKNTKTNKILNEIKQSILICDENNFEEAFFGEHIADKHEKVSSSLMIAASLALLTKKIQFFGSFLALIIYIGICQLDVVIQCSQKGLFNSEVSNRDQIENYFGPK